MAGSYRTADATVSAHSAVVVTPSDTTVLPTTRGLYAGVAGNVAVTMSDNQNSVTFVGVQAGSILPVQVTKVLATGTTATNILALY